MRAFILFFRAYYVEDKCFSEVVSRPLLKIATWRYWFRLSRDVYDGNRSFASYTKTKTVESDV
jgi:hypothetical protein